MKKVLVLLGVLFSLAFFLLKADNTSLQAISKTISVDEFERKMNSLASYELVDLRTNDEIALGKIPEAKQIDFYASDFETQIKRLPKSRPVLIYCASGGRSRKALSKMKDIGFQEVYELSGGFAAWSYAGKKIER